MPNLFGPMQSEKPAIKSPGWGLNYYVDEAGNKINNNPNMNYYFDAKGNVQQFGKPQVDWSKATFGQNPYETLGALLGDETIVNNPHTQAPTAPPTAPAITPTTEAPSPTITPTAPTVPPLASAIGQNIPTTPPVTPSMPAVPLAGALQQERQRASSPWASSLQAPVAADFGVSAGYGMQRNPLEEAMKRIRRGGAQYGTMGYR